MVAQTKAPFASARITLIDGEQGNGKSVTGVARIVDAYYADAVGIYCRERLGISCEVILFPFVVMGLLCILLLVYGIITGNLSW